jgi:hypothetical protein
MKQPLQSATLEFREVPAPELRLTSLEAPLALDMPLNLQKPGKRKEMRHMAHSAPPSTRSGWANWRYTESKEVI